ncbi:hypothetical protein [Streptomyces sp. cg36]|uniref:hypothetical protein n=1 Tax=Streptomyces sp. cg36 TaxID=3238798 RepID=UPI0034E27177
MATRTETDASQWEYTTFAPKGETCPVCMKPIKSLEVCKRGTFNRPSGPVVVYQHTGCTDMDGAKRQARQ